MVAGDGMPGLDIKGKRLSWDSPYEDYAGHPRAAGTHAATLRIARENGVPLMHTIAQLSYWSAKHIGDTGLKAMQERGRLQEGMVADITIFDPKNVTEHANFKSGTNGLPSTGIPYVLVNGTIVVKDSKVLKDVFPGQPIRFPVEGKGRFVPASGKSWLKIYTIKNNPKALDLDDSVLNPGEVKGRTTGSQSSLIPEEKPIQRRGGDLESKMAGGLFVSEPIGLAKLFDCQGHGHVERHEHAELKDTNNLAQVSRANRKVALNSRLKRTK